jgi:hypothetical protein
VAERSRRSANSVTEAEQRQHRREGARAAAAKRARLGPHAPLYSDPLQRPCKVCGRRIVFMAKGKPPRNENGTLHRC